LLAGAAKFAEKVATSFESFSQSTPQNICLRDKAIDKRHMTTCEQIVRTAPPECAFDWKPSSFAPVVNFVKREQISLSLGSETNSDCFRFHGLTVMKKN
jgi:hypothetical protein